jgi:DMSO reductase anchor subunit
VMMWRTSWLSREVIVLPAFIGVTALWWLALWSAGPQPGPLTKLALPLLVSALAGLLWLCTAQIYNCLRFIQEWAHPLTLVNYTLIGLSSGLVLGCAVAVLAGEQAWLAAAAPWTLAATAAAGLGRGLALRRNARLKPVSTLQSATGIQARRLVQTSMGMTGGAFNTREFFHGATLSALRQLRVLLMVFGFGLPLLCLAAGCWQLRAAAPGPGAAWPWLLALAFQAPGLLAERWMFFAQARHPQNLYYQVVS